MIFIAWKQHPTRSFGCRYHKTSERFGHGTQIWHCKPRTQVHSTVSRAFEKSQEIASKEYASKVERHNLRCALCYEPDFQNLTQLAEHVVGRRHSDLFPTKDRVSNCPYCGAQLGRQALYEHIKFGECKLAGEALTPKSQRRQLLQEDIDQMPEYSPIVRERINGGWLKIRPMHMQHTFEAALVITEAFVIDLEPPRFGWMLSELRRHALIYERDPSPVVSHHVNFLRKTPDVQPESVSDVVKEAPGSFSSIFPGPSLAEKKDVQRREAENAWGIWLWLVADFIPDDPRELPEGQDSKLVGATAMLFHDRAAALENMQLLSPPMSAPALDYSLWLDNRPPLDLEHKKAVFIWWTSTSTAFRRQGVARCLLRGCEAVGAAAGFWSFYIQAAMRQRDRNSLLGAWLPKEYVAAVQAYRKAGYVEHAPHDEAESLWSRSNPISSSAVLMYKQF